MNTRQVAWCGSDCDLNYPVAGNLDMSAGSKGTMSFWATKLGPHNAHYTNECWFSYGTGGSQMRIRPVSGKLYFYAGSVDWTRCGIGALPINQPLHVVVTWDFTGGAGAGQLRIYCNNEDPLTLEDDADGYPDPQPDEWYLGSEAGQIGYGARSRFDNWAVWDDVMTAEQRAALYAKGPHYMPVGADGEGNLTFLADFNGTYDARVAGGDGTASHTTDMVRLYEAGVNPDQRVLLRLGNKVDDQDVAAGVVEDLADRLPIETVFYAETGSPTLSNQDGYGQIVIPSGAAAKVVGRLAGLGELSIPHRVRVRLNVQNLGTGRLWLHGGGWQTHIYADRVEMPGTSGTVRVLLDETYAGEYLFVDLEWVWTEEGGGYNGFLVANNAQVAMGGQYSSFGLSAGNVVIFETQTADDWGGWAGDVTVRLESMEVGGPPLYTGAYQRTDNLFDEFSVVGKVWRQEQVSRQLASPQACASNPVFELADVTSWSPSAIRYVDAQAVGEQLRIIIWGADASSNRMGYIWSSDGENWSEDAQNPVLDLTQFNRGFGERIGVRGSTQVRNIVEDEEGKYWLFISGWESGAPDDFHVYAVGPADTPYDFDYTMLFYGNPVARASGQRFGDFSEVPQLFPNKDLDLNVVRNPYARHPWQRYLGAGRCKHGSDSYTGGTDYRVWACAQSPDLVTWRGLHPAAVPYPIFNYGHLGQIRVIARDLYVHYVEFGTLSETDAYRIVAEGSGPGAIPLKPFIDCVGGRHFHEVGFASLGGTTYYFSTLGSELHMYSMREGGEAYYQIEAGETDGFVQTCAIAKPSAGWGKLMVNVDQLSGSSSLKVAVLDPDTEQPVAGHDTSDCDLDTNGTSVEVTWGGSDLSGLTGEHYMLRLEFSRTGPTDPSPLLYGYEVQAAVHYKPVVSNLTAEGQVNPANVIDPTPEFCWSYWHPTGEPQVAYQLIVSSTLANLDNEMGDVWDSGEVAGSETTCTYAGPSLAEHSVYYWKVRAKSSGGEWSDW